MCTMLHPRANYTLSVLASEGLLPCFVQLLYNSLVCIHQCVQMMLGLGE